jgi:hypothetical protein
VLALSAFLYFAHEVFSCWLAWQVEDLSIQLVLITRECTPPYLCQTGRVWASWPAKKDERSVKGKKNSNADVM